MTHTTQKQLERAMEKARTEGYAVVGFAVKPQDGGCMKLDNQHLDRDTFVTFLHTALAGFSEFTTDKPLIHQA